MTEDLPTWFGQYNGRQTIEAGIKESKQVFYLHRLKVRSEPAIYLQEAMTIFAANFIRWAIVWIEQNSEHNENQLQLGKMGIKRQVQVAAHTSAKVIQNSNGKLLKFSPASSLAGPAVASISGFQSPDPSKIFFATFYNSCSDCAKVTLDKEIQSVGI